MLVVDRLFCNFYFRDLPEAVFTNDLLIRFEEAGAILNVVTREKHLKILIDNLPLFNKVLLSWLMTHFSNVVANVRTTRNISPIF